MTKEIEPKQIFIGDYLKLDKNDRFVIPEYQRDYSWTLSQCEKLWQDVESFSVLDVKEPYFFGTVITDRSEKHKNEIHIIDGQQRTTTFLLLLKALQLQLQETLDTLEKLPKDEIEEPLRKDLERSRDAILGIFLKDDEVEEILKLLNNWDLIKETVLVENKSMNEQYGTDLEIILKSKSFTDAESKVTKIPKKQKDNKYSNFFRNFKFFYKDKVCKLHQIQLNKFAKTFLKKCQIIEIRSWQVEQAIQMFNSLNSTGLPLADADIISAKMYQNYTGDKTLFLEKWKEFKSLISDLETQDIVSIDSILQQVMYIERATDKKKDVNIPSVRNYYLVEKEELLNSPLDLCDKFLKIAKSWDKISDYPSVKVLLKLNENAKIFFASYLSTFELEEISEPVILPITECFLRLFTILELSETVYSSTGFKTFLFDENVKLVDRTVSVEQLCNDFSTHINNYWNENDIKESILEYQNNILVYLNEYLYAKKENLPFDFDKSVNIEHIMPSSGKNKDAIQEMAGINDKEEFNELVNALGNKILLEANINKSIQDEWFRLKKTKSIKDKAGYKDSKYPIAQSLTNFSGDYWGKDEIESTTKKIAARIVDFIFAK